LVPYLHWNFAEGLISFIAVCLPALFYLFKQIQLMGLRYLISKGCLKSDDSKSCSSAREIKNSERVKCLLPGWDTIYEGSGFGTYVTVSGGSAARESGDGELENPPLHGIGIKEEVTMVVTDIA
jgi:microcompartment protein CcmK/EutM